MPAQPTFGPRIGSYEVEDAVLTVLRERLPTYVDASARLLGIDPDTAEGFRIRPKTLCRRAPFTGFPKSELPLVEVVFAQMAKPPEKGRSGLLTMFFEFDISCFVAARDYEATRALRAAWEMGLSWCLLQSQSLGGIALAVDQLAEGINDDILGDSRRTLQGSAATFVATIPNCLDPLAGPATFLPDDGDPPALYDPPVSADSVTIDLEHLS